MFVVFFVFLHFVTIQVDCYKVDTAVSPRLRRMWEHYTVKIGILSFDEETIKSVKLKLPNKELSKNHLDGKIEMKKDEELIVETRGFGEIKLEVSLSKTELINTKRIVSIVVPQFFVGMLFNHRQKNKTLVSG